MTNKNEWTPQKIKDLRAKLGKTQKAFAKMVGVHVGTVIRWEKGDNYPLEMALKSLKKLEKTTSS